MPKAADQDQMPSVQPQWFASLVARYALQDANESSSEDEDKSSDVESSNCDYEEASTFTL